MNLKFKIADLKVGKRGAVLMALAMLGVVHAFGATGVSPGALVAVTNMGLYDVLPLSTNAYGTNAGTRSIALKDFMMADRGSMSVNMARIPHLNKALTGSNLVTIADLGDSMGVLGGYLTTSLMWPTIGSNGAASGGPNLSMFYEFTSNAGQQLPVADTAATNWFANYIAITNTGGIVTWRGYVQDLYMNTGIVYYVNGTNLGSFKVQTSTNGAAWADVVTIDCKSASNTRTGMMAAFSVPLGWWRFRAVWVSGTSYIPMGRAWNSTGPGLHYVQLAAAGSDFSIMTRVDTNIVHPILASLNIDAMFVEEKSSAAHWSTSAIPMLTQWLNGPLTNTDVVLVGTTLSETEVGVDTALQNATMRRFATALGLPYFDAQTPLGTWEQMTNTFGRQDTVHRTTAANVAMAAALGSQLGIADNAGIAGDVRQQRPYANYARLDLANTFVTGQRVAGELYLSGASGYLNLQTHGSDAGKYWQIAGDADGTLSLRHVGGIGYMAYLSDGGGGAYGLIPNPELMAFGLTLGTNAAWWNAWLSNVMVVGSIKLGPQATAASVTNWLKYSATLQFANLPAQSSTNMTIACTGAAQGDVVSMGIPATAYTTSATNVTFSGFASNDVVFIKAVNSSAAAATLNSATFRGLVVKVQ